MSGKTILFVLQLEVKLNDRLGAWDCEW